MKLTTALENVKFYAYHGMYDFEQERGGEFIVNITVDEEIDDHAPLNNIEKLVNYETLFAIAKEEMANTRHFIEDVARSMLQRVSHGLLGKQVEVTVKITKLNPAGKFTPDSSASVTLKI